MSGSVAEAAPPRRAVLLVNPEARRGDQRIDGIVARLGAGGIALIGEPASSPDELGRIVRGTRQTRSTAAIVCGGDGSLCRSAPALLATRAALGIMPMGTANDLARTLGIPDDLEQAADIVIAGHRRRIDLGTVNGHPFFNVASIGLATDLARELSSDLKQRWGRLGYAVAAVRVLAQGAAVLGLDQRERRRDAHPDAADRGRQRPLLRRRHRRRAPTRRSTTGTSTSTASSSAPSGGWR